MRNPRVLIEREGQPNIYVVLKEDKENNIVWFERKGKKLSAEAVNKAGGTAVSSDSELLERLIGYGLKCRKGLEQHPISVALDEDTDKRLRESSVYTGMSISEIVSEALNDWFEKNDK